jgi:prepilin-type N-terminal cleavage/methylation domain-containing protein
VPRGSVRRSRARAAFTLLEILVVLALIGLLGTVLVGGSARLLKDKPTTPEDILRKAINEARKFAVETNREVRLTFDSKEKIFTATSAEGSRIIASDLPGDWGVDFLVAQKGGGAMLLGGVLVETQTVTYVTFYPDGTCVPFRAQLRVTGGARTIAIDPWTCAPVLESEPK